MPSWATQLVITLMEPGRVSTAKSIIDRAERFSPNHPENLWHSALARLAATGAIERLGHGLYVRLGEPPPACIDDAWVKQWPPMASAEPIPTSDWWSSGRCSPRPQPAQAGHGRRR